MPMRPMTHLTTVHPFALRAPAVVTAAVALVLFYVCVPWLLARIVFTMMVVVGLGNTWLRHTDPETWTLLGLGYGMTTFVLIMWIASRVGLF
jgi:hypothetical protein